MALKGGGYHDGAFITQRGLTTQTHYRQETHRTRGKEDEMGSQAGEEPEVPLWAHGAQTRTGTSDRDSNIGTCRLTLCTERTCQQ